MNLPHIHAGACLLGLLAGPAAAQRAHGGVAFHGGFAHPGFVSRPFIHPGFVGRPFHPGFVRTGPRFFFGFGGPVVIAPPAYPYPFYPYAYPYPPPPYPYPYYPPPY